MLMNHKDFPNAQQWGCETWPRQALKKAQKICGKDWITKSTRSSYTTRTRPKKNRGSRNISSVSISPGCAKKSFPSAFHQRSAVTKRNRTQLTSDLRAPIFCYKGQNP